LTLDSQTKLSAASAEHHLKLSDAQRDYHQKLTASAVQHKVREDELVAVCERTRQDKEAAVKAVTQDREEARSQFEARLDALDLLSKRQQNLNTELRSSVLELQTALT
jgi:hypothetical protein